MKIRTKKGDSLRFVEKLVWQGKGKRSKKLLAQADRLDKNALLKKKAQKKHLMKVRGEG